MSLFDTGIRPDIDDYLLKKSQEVRDYGEYWSASSAGYCMRKVMFDRLKVPKSKEDARKQRVFEVGHIFHEWIQRITKEAGISVAQELELQDKGLMVRGHIDDLALISKIKIFGNPVGQLVLYDYKTQNSRAFSFQKDRPMSYYHRMQLGTYMYMLRESPDLNIVWPYGIPENIVELIGDLSEGRILKISKDDLRMSEQQLLWSDELKTDVAQYWGMLNEYWGEKTLPQCTCADREGGFLAKEAYNDYFFEKEPCSIEWLKRCAREEKVDIKGWKVEA